MEENYSLHVQSLLHAVWTPVLGGQKELLAISKIFCSSLFTDFHPTVFFSVCLLLTQEHEDLKIKLT